jgi:hypothetical protein
MDKIRLFLTDILRRPSLYFFVFLAVFTVDRHHRYESGIGEWGTFYYDVLEYYRYLPDIFINDPETSEHFLRTNKRTVGMAIMYSPAFVVGHLLAYIQDVPASGYTEPYQWSVRWGSIIYSIIGLFFLRRCLLRFFPELIVMITLITVFFATNLLYYTYSWGEMPHSYLFFLYAAFIHVCFRFLIDGKAKALLWMGFLAGFITLIRPTGIVVLLFPLLFNVNSFRTLKERIVQLVSHRMTFIVAILLFWIPLFLQMLVWKRYVGQFVYYSYGDNKFFFNDPKIVPFLIGIRKGWLVYTPAMAFSLIGIALSLKRLRSFFTFLVIYLPLTVYILSCWWDWSSGGSFGCRVLIESYTFLAFPLAVFIQFIWQIKPGKLILNSFTRAMLIAAIIFFIKLNFVQLWQLKYGIMHWSGLNTETYRFLFMKEDFTKEDIKYLKSKTREPDYNKMLKGDRDQ